ncbi:MAG: TIGR00341 family protein [Patescibacteria group bacterium]
MIKIGNIIKIKNNQTDNKKRFITEIINASAPNLDFYLMVILSALMTSLGLIANNLALVIAGMIVAPLLSPILAMSLATSILGSKLFIRSLKILAVSFMLSISVSFLVGMIFDFNIGEIDLIQKMNVSYLTLSIAVVAGITASYAWTRENSKDYLSGIAIAVTIIPPLSSIGISLAASDASTVVQVFNFFLMNVFGIFLGGIFVFPVMRFYKVKKTVLKEIKKEENSLTS